MRPATEPDDPIMVWGDCVVFFTRGGIEFEKYSRDFIRGQLLALEFGSAVLAAMIVISLLV
jgi:hypothetical protein